MNGVSGTNSRHLWPGVLPVGPGTIPGVGHGMDSGSGRFCAWRSSGHLREDGERSHDGPAGKREPHPATGTGQVLVSVWASANNLTLGQVQTEEKSNEITAIPNLSEMLEPEGCIVTVDVKGCQKKIARGSGNGYRRATSLLHRQPGGLSRTNAGHSRGPMEHREFTG